MKKQNGITLIALIITIILLLMISGVVLSLTIGKNGLIKITKYATQKNSEEVAKEKLELVLGNLQASKYTDKLYNENEYVDNYLENQGMKISENIVTVDNWNFEIDRSIPEVKANLGETTVKITKQVKEYLGKNENNKYMVSVLVKIESNIKMQCIEFENIDGTILKVVAQKQTLAKDMQIELDKEYKITVKMANGKIENKTIIERSIENINTVEEFVAFRDKVNSGLTYEGKTINLLKDIDLGSVCGANINGQEISWEPIGTDKTYFKGIFDGNYHTISRLYYNSNAYNWVGLFAQNGGTVQNLILDNVKIHAYGSRLMVGGIAGCEGTIINCGVNSGDITSSGSEYIMTGGIAGRMAKTLNCYNKANITSYSNSTGAYAGGIIGAYGKVENCYNTGIIHAGGVDGSLSGGIIGEEENSPNYVKNSYNIGTVNATGPISIGGIIGRNGWSSVYQGVSVINSYCTTETTYLYAGYSSSIENIVEKETLKTYAQNLGKEYTEDIEIVKTDELTGETTKVWKYNNGYPILKWQLKNK